ncbi:MAG: 50S ribosomal protein L22 [Candidatus Moranbacteria bacterium RIFOXYA12_FULL_44_15]|nr:MAG: 50S ribosomal protein L22 [Candidatus Moranbacteria bacterium RIFOXYA12_FULL_44_15]OGI34242.1 MAG: 50S ribosomal protein L22 [Candidatus Moranbacteria bacterium RIFOXYA2_FULL_43_15]
MKVKASLKSIRIAPRKVRLSADLIKGLDVRNALNQLDNTVKGSNADLKKLLESAIANGENNSGIDRNNMYVFDVTVGAGPSLKRWMPKAFGRAGRILKRTSKIEIVLEEREEGKNRKSKEQMEKEKKERQKEREKIEKERQKEREEQDGKEGVETTTEKVEDKREDITGRKENKTKNWTNRIFRRKSM